MKFFTKLLLMGLLIGSAYARNNDQDVRSFISLSYVKSMPRVRSGDYAFNQYQGIGLGLRATLPFFQRTYIGLLVEGAYKNIGYSLESDAGLGLAADIKLFDDIYLSADYGLASYLNTFDTSYFGTFWDTGLHWWVSDYIDLSTVYKQNNLGYAITNRSFLQTNEVKFSLNIKLTAEMLVAIAKILNF